MARHERREHRPGPGSPAVGIIVTTFLLLLAACSSSGPGSSAGTTVGDEGTPVDGGTLVFAIPAETNGWNPTTSAWASYGVLVGSTMLEPLAMYNSEGGTADPWLALSWTPNDAFDVWTLALRPNVTFADGEPFDADAVKLNIDRMVDAPISGTALGGSFREVKVLSPLTVEIDLTHPWAAFPTSYLAGQSALMMAPAMLSSPDAGATHPIGTGPFVFDSWEPDRVLKVRKNPNYWRSGLPHLDGIEFRVMTDSTSRANALQAGDVDSFETADAAAANNAPADAKVVKDWHTEPSMLITNTLPDVDGHPNPTSNEHARRALAYATDRQAVAASVGEGVESPTSPFAPDSLWGRPADQNNYPDHDLERAKQEVEAYKRDTGEQALSLTLATSPDPVASQVMQLVQSQWAQAGIDAQIVQIENAALIQNVVFGRYEVAYFSFYTSPDPDQDRYFWSSETAKGPGSISINFTQFHTPEMDRALDIGRTNPDFQARKQAYDTVIDEINGATTNIWLFWTPYSVISASHVHGMEGAAGQHIATFQPKSFFADVWVTT